MVLKLRYLYHKDFDRNNMFCAFDAEGSLLAAAHLIKDDTFDAVGHDDDPAYIRYLIMEMAFGEQGETPELRAALREALLGRWQELRAEYPGRRIVLAQCVDTSKPEEAEDLLRNGFTVYHTIPIFKYDLEQSIPEYPLAEGLECRMFRVNEQGLALDYHETELACFDGAAWSINHLQWMEGSPEMLHYGAFHQGKLVGCVSTWKITEERSATENVFVRSEWRGKGVARSLLYTALRNLQQEGKSIATLGTQGTNRRAIRLYTDMGYKPYGFLLMLGYEEK